MGWRGTLRSINAANNRAARHRERLDRASARAHAGIDKLEGAINLEVAKEVAKLKALEESFKRAPITKTGITFDPAAGKFKLKTIKDEKGHLHYSIDLALSPTNHLPEARQFKVDGHLLTIEAVAFAPYATYAAIKVERAPGQIQEKRKFIFKQSPAKSLVRIESESQVYLPVEGTIDAPVMGPPYIGIVAFAPFAIPVDAFAITFYIDGQAVPVQFEGVHDEVDEEINAVSIADQFAGGIEPEIQKSKSLAATSRAQVDEIVNPPAQSSSGCLVLILGVVIAAIVFGFFHFLG